MIKIEYQGKEIPYKLQRSKIKKFIYLYKKWRSNNKSTT